MVLYEAFESLEIRVGRILRAESNPRTRKPAYKLWIDFGAELGTHTSSAQITELYSPESLISRQVICATNLGTRNIAGFEFQVLTLGVNDPEGRVVLLQPEREVSLGERIY